MSISQSTSRNASNETLIKYLKGIKVIKDKRVENVMLSVDRADYCLKEPYEDSPREIGYNATISAPHIHALVLELLKDHLNDGDVALDVGSGSGYLTTCMALMVGQKGRVVGIDHIGELVDLSKNNISKHHGCLLTSGRITLVAGDGRNGYRQGAPYKAIHVGAFATELPDELVDQLALGGRMIIPMGDLLEDQHLIQVDKSLTGNIKVKKLFGVIFVPLTDKQDQLKRFELP